MRPARVPVLPLLALLLLALPALTRVAGAIDTEAAAAVGTVPVSALDSAGMTVSNMARALDFYTRVLPFVKESDVELSGRNYELVSGVFGARARVVRLRLGDEHLELTEYLAPRGRPVPDDMRPNDHAFQHIAIIVSDMSRAYAHLRQAGVAHASSSPQRLPDWNANAGGISAFYFRDPDRHYLEILQFPAGKGLAQWQRTDALFLGIDHTAIVSSDTERSLAFYRDVLRMNVAGESENYDSEQEHLNGVFGARLRITALRAALGPGIELLEYLAPRSGRPAPVDLDASDIAHWQTTLITTALDRVAPLARRHSFALVSPFPAAVEARELGLAQAMLVRDPDGHGIRLATRAR